jgi:lysophospholipase L1-like esterase
MKTHKQQPLFGRAGSRIAAGFAVALVLFGLQSPMLAQSGSSDRWVGTWATAPAGRLQNPPPPNAPLPPFMPSACPAPAGPPAVAPAPGQTFAPAPYTHFTNQTLRQIVHTSIGGSKARVVLTNVYGTAPLTIGAANIALREKDAAIQAASSRPLTFSGATSVTIPQGAIMYSDAVNLTVPQMGDLAIDLYLPGTTNTPSTLTIHNGAFQTNYISETGNHVGKAALPTVGRTQNWFLLSRVEVVAPDAAGAIVVFGDSITDGTRSTPDTNSRWPNVLARRLLSQNPPVKLGILNAAIAGNRVLSEASVPAGSDPRAVGAGINALARFELDALAQPGVTHIVVMEGINDIGNARQNASPTAQDIINGYKQMIERAHTRGIKIYGATLTPFYGAAYYTEVGEAKRQAVNEWIRTSNAFDGVIDFDKVTRDPANPKQFLAAYDSCDRLHPSDAGYKAMADSIDLNLFKTAPVGRTSR